MPRNTKSYRLADGKGAIVRYLFALALIAVISMAVTTDREVFLEKVEQGGDLSTAGYVIAQAKFLPVEGECFVDKVGDLWVVELPPGYAIKLEHSIDWGWVLEENEPENFTVTQCWGEFVDGECVSTEGVPFPTDIYCIGQLESINLERYTWTYSIRIEWAAPVQGIEDQSTYPALVRVIP